MENLNDPMKTAAPTIPISTARKPDLDQNPMPPTHTPNTASITVTANNPPLNENATTTQVFGATLSTPGNHHRQSGKTRLEPYPDCNDNAGSSTSPLSETKEGSRPEQLPCLSLNPEDFPPNRESEWHCSATLDDQQEDFELCLCKKHDTRVGPTTDDPRSQSSGRKTQ